MADPADGTGGLNPAEAFSLLGDPVRLEIVTALYDASPNTPIPFSTLYERVDVEGTGQFNYHRDQLVPHFVSKTENGYELTAAGRRIARAVAAGTYTERPRLAPFEIDGDCYACGAAALRASYENETFRVNCDDCDVLVIEVRVPSSLVPGREPTEFAEAIDRWSRSQVEQAARGLCPNCGGSVEPSTTEEIRDTITFEAVATFDCAVCGRRVITSFSGLAHRHPTVEAFHRERGVSLRDRPYWEIEQFVSGDHVRIVSRDPWLVQVSFSADGDTCHVRLDGDLDVVETEIVTDD